MTATLTVDRHSGTSTSFGCDNLTGQLANCSVALTPVRFAYEEGYTAEVVKIEYEAQDGSLEFGVVDSSGSNRGLGSDWRRLTLHLGGKSFPLANGQNTEVNHTWRFVSAGISWTDGQQVQVRVTAIPRPQASIFAAPGVAVEGNSVRLGARLSKPHTSNVTIQLTAYNATSETGDYDSVSSITIPAGATRNHVWIRTHHDTDEADERFGVRINAGSLPAGVELGEPSGALFTILDDEPLPKVSLSATPNPVNEGRAVTITATLSKAAPDNVRIPLWFLKGTSEFEDVGEVLPISITAGQTSGTTTVATVADSDADDEWFGIAVGNLAVTPCSTTETWCTVAKGSPSRVDITIRDGTEPEITLTVDSTSVAEGEDVTVTISLSEPVPIAANETVLIPFVIEHLSAEIGDLKYVSEGINRVRMDGGMTSQTVVIGTTVDDDTEDDSFAVRLEATVAAQWPDWATLGTPFSADILITDQGSDEGEDADSGSTATGTIQMSAREISVRESGTGFAVQAHVPVTLSRAATQTITVAYETGFGDADEGDDFEGYGNNATNPPGTLTFAAGETSKDIVINILDDTVEDSGESFCIVFQNLTPASVVAWGGGYPCGFASVEVFILNEEADLEDLKLWGAPAADGPYTRLDFGRFDLGTIVYQMTVPHDTTHAKIAGVSPYNESQTLMVGHEGSQLTSVGSDEASPALALAEGTNNLVVEVTGATGEQKTYSVIVTRAPLPTIGDVPGLDSDTVSLSASPNPVTEGRSVTVTATLSKARAEALTVPLTTTRDTSEDGDHRSLTSVTVPAGSTSASAIISTSKDDDADDETFTVALGALPQGLSAGAAASVQVTILDPGPPRPRPITASFENVPDEHDGATTFALNVRFSKSLGRDVPCPDESLVHRQGRPGQGCREAQVETVAGARLAEVVARRDGDAGRRPPRATRLVRSARPTAHR